MYINNIYKYTEREAEDPIVASFLIGLLLKVGALRGTWPGKLEVSSA